MASGKVVKWKSGKVEKRKWQIEKWKSGEVEKCKWYLEKWKSGKVENLTFPLSRFSAFPFPVGDVRANRTCPITVP